MPLAQKNIILKKLNSIGLTILIVYVWMKIFCLLMLIKYTFILAKKFKQKLTFIYHNIYFTNLYSNFD